MPITTVQWQTIMHTVSGLKYGLFRHDHNEWEMHHDISSETQLVQTIISRRIILPTLYNVAIKITAW